MLRLMLALVIAAPLMLLTPFSLAQDTAMTAGQRAEKAIATLKSDAPLQEKFAACQTLAAVGDARAVPVLAGLLADEKLAHMARYALEPIPGPAAADALRGAMDKLTGELLVGVINSVAQRRDAKAVEALIKRTRDADPAVAPAAVAALGRIASPDALTALAGLRRADAEATRLAAADASLWAAATLAPGDGKDAVYKDLLDAAWPKRIRLGAFVGSLAARPDDAAARIVQAIAGKDDLFRAAAIAHIPALTGPGVVERFAAEMPKLPADAQVLLIGALVQRADPAGRSAIVSAAGSDDPAVRTAAAEALGAVGDASCVEVLCRLVAEGKTAGEKQAAAAGLRSLRADGTDAAIVAALKDAPAALRVALIDALADRHAAGSVGELLAQAAQTDRAVCSAAFKALGRLAGPKDLPAMLDLLVKLPGDAGRREAELAAATVCRRIDDELSRADAPLAALKSADDPAAKASLLRVLAGAANAKAFDAVFAATTNADPAVRDAAVRGLADWPNERALPALLELFASTKDPAHRVLALRGCVRLLGLGQRPAAETLDTYRTLVKQADRPEDKRLVLSGLAGVADAAALAIIEPFIADAPVRAEAELAALKVARSITGSAPEQAGATAKKLAADAKSEPVRQQAAEVVRQLQMLADYVTAWQVSDAYPLEGQTSKNVFAEAFAPEMPGAKDVHWRPLPLSTTERPWMYDLHIVLGGSERACYVRTWVHSDKRQPARLEFGTDDGSKVWFNGKLVHASDVGGAAAPGEHKIDVTLNEGWNALLLKVVQITGPWQFCLAVRAPDGSPLPGLRYSPLPPAETNRPAAVPPENSVHPDSAAPG